MQKLQDSMARVDEAGTGSLAVCFIDLDRFKPVNDEHGHRVGDKVLQSVTSRIRTMARQGDFLARIGGDEFVLVLPAADAGLVRYADRAGGIADIRASLAADDLAWRRKHPGKLLERAFSLTTYFDAYKAMWLDAYAELQRWRDAGVRTLGCADLFRVMAFAQLTWRESLRDIEACLAANQAKLFSKRGDDEV